jgi:hypothetical protein
VTASRSEQVSVALDYVRGKRRIELVLEAALALVDRYGEEPDLGRRLEVMSEMLRRNFGAQVSVHFGAASWSTVDDSEAAATCHFQLVGRDGTTGSLTARHVSCEPLGLTADEWTTALRLLVSIAGLGLGGRARWVR